MNKFNSAIKGALQKTTVLLLSSVLFSSDSVSSFKSMILLNIKCLFDPN